jgi:hypothetical protein
MQTRTTDYSVALKPFTDFYLKKCKNFNRNRKHKNGQQLILGVIQILKMELDYFYLYHNVKDEHDVISIEKKLQLNLKKIKHFKEESLEQLNKPNQTAEFKKTAAKLFTICDMMHAKIQDYYNRKFICILFRSNSDIYRHIKSFIL